MKAILDYLAPRLTAIGVILILAYIGYNELFRSSPVNAELKKAIGQSQHAQTELQHVKSQLLQQKKELKFALGTINSMNGQLTMLDDSITRINGRYQAFSSKMNQEKAIDLERYQQQKKHIQDIQKQIQ